MEGLYYIIVIIYLFIIIPTINTLYNTQLYLSFLKYLGNIKEISTVNILRVLIAYFLYYPTHRKLKSRLRERPK